MKKRSKHGLSHEQIELADRTVSTALIALGFGTATADHHRELLYALAFSLEVAATVGRYDNIKIDIQRAALALNHISDRGQPYSGTAAELDAIKLGLEIFRGINRTCSIKTVERVTNKINALMHAAISGLPLDEGFHVSQPLPNRSPNQTGPHAAHRP